MPETEWFDDLGWGDYWPRCFLYLLAASMRALFGFAPVSSSRAMKIFQSLLVNSVTLCWWSTEWAV